MRQYTGQDFTAKDRRTWAGTVLAASTLRAHGPTPSQTAANTHIIQAIDAVAKRLGNTRTVCRTCYVHPTILDAYLDGTLCLVPLPGQLPPGAPETPGLYPEEAMVLNLLKQRGTPPALPSQQAS
ncbi:MAG: hypothetical protein AB7N91_27335 [Candidatus Tectimicrobiota bacterium]